MKLKCKEAGWTYVILVKDGPKHEIDEAGVLELEDDADVKLALASGSFELLPAEEPEAQEPEGGFSDIPSSAKVGQPTITMEPLPEEPEGEGA